MNTEDLQIQLLESVQWRENSFHIGVQKNVRMVDKCMKELGLRQPEDNSIPHFRQNTLLSEIDKIAHSLRSDIEFEGTDRQKTLKAQSLFRTNGASTFQRLLWKVYDKQGPWVWPEEGREHLIKAKDSDSQRCDLYYSNPLHCDYIKLKLDQICWERYILGDTPDEDLLNSANGSKDKRSRVGTTSLSGSARRSNYVNITTPKSNTRGSVKKESRSNQHANTLGFVASKKEACSMSQRPESPSEPIHDQQSNNLDPDVVMSCGSASMDSEQTPEPMENSYPQSTPSQTTPARDIDPETFVLNCKLHFEGGTPEDKLYEVFIEVLRHFEDNDPRQMSPFEDHCRELLVRLWLDSRAKYAENLNNNDIFQVKEDVFATWMKLWLLRRRLEENPSNRYGRIDAKRGISKSREAWNEHISRRSEIPLIDHLSQMVEMLLGIEGITEDLKGALRQMLDHFMLG